MVTTVEFIVFFLIFITAVFLGYLAGKKITEVKERSKMEKWKIDWEKDIREDAIKRSRAVIEGKITEQLAPFLPDFRYNPDDARFLGSPIDLMVFDGLSTEDPKEIVFIEIKKGLSNLSLKEKKIRELVERKKVKWELYRMP